MVAAISLSLSGLVAMMKLPTGMIRRRKYGKFFVVYAPVANTTVSAVTVPRGGLEFGSAVALTALRDERVFKNGGPIAGGSRGQAGNVPAHMHHGALSREHRTMERVRSDLGGKVFAAQQGRVWVHLPVKNLEVAGQRIHMRWLRRQFQLAGTSKGAVNRLFPDDAFDRVDGIVKGAVERLRTIRPKMGFGGQVAVGDAIVEVTAVSPGRAGADEPALQNGDTYTCLGKMQGRGQTGETAADDGERHNVLRQAPAPLL